MPADFLPGQNFECTMCGLCCRDVWSVGVDEACRARLVGSDLVRRLAAGGPVLVRGGAGWRAAVRDGSCVFLDEAGLCSIQKELGEGTKPLGCTQFPFLVVRTPEGPVVGASFCCPAIQANHGRPLREWETWLQGCADPAGAPPVGFQPLDAGGGRTLDWAGYLRLEGELREDARSADPARALFRRLQGFCQELRDGEPGAEGFDPGLMVLRPYLLATLVGTIEAPSPEEAPGFSRTFLSGDRVRFHRFGWEGDPGFLLEHLDTPGPEPLEREVARYLDALLFRKWPALDRPVLCNLVLLSLLPWLARCYAWAAADARGASEPEPEDAHRALSWIELRLVTHASGLEPLLASLAEAVLRQVVRQATPRRRAPRAPRWRLPAAAAAAGFALLFGLGVLFSPAAPPAAASVALVVEEPAGHGDDPALRTALHAHQGAATILLEPEELRDRRLVEDLARDGDEVGVVLHAGTPEPEVEELREFLSRTEHLDLQAVYTEADDAARALSGRGYRVLRQRPVHLADEAEAARLAAGLGDGSVVVVEAGPTTEYLVGELARRGVHVTTLAHLASAPALH